MRLKHIKLAGFKSFVDPTKVPFEQQMTAIVGPNGCGKSNIIDAVRWVLGESSAKNLRGDAMTDVIFNGASTRKAVGQASVELLFDNMAERIQGSMADRNQVSIRRVVNRDSQNSYYLNGTKCRKKDITDIFLGTGLGPRSYAIIEQGTISRLIESKPQELRVFIEEAAGISKYKERRKDTENRIRHTRENLERLTDIRIELNNQIEKLHQQAEAAKRFKLLKGQERKFKAELAVLKWQKFDQQLQNNQINIEQLEQQVEQKVLFEKSEAVTLFTSKQSLQDCHEKIQHLQQIKIELTNNTARLEQQITHQAQQDKKLAEDKKINQQQLQHAQQSLLLEQEQLTKLNHENKDIQPSLNHFNQKLVQLEQDLTENNAQLIKKQDIWQKNHQEQEQDAKFALEHARKKAQYSEIIEQKKLRLVHVVGQVKQLSNQEDCGELAISNEVFLLKEQVEQLFTSQGALLLQIQENQHACLTLTQQKSELSGSNSAYEKQICQLEQKLAEKNDWQTQQHTWLQNEGLNDLGLLQQQLCIEPGWELAVEMVISQQLHATLLKELPHKLLKSDTLPDVLSLIADSQLTEKLAQNTLASKIKGNQCIAHLFNQIKVATDPLDAVKQVAMLNVGESVICPQGFWLNSHFVRKGLVTSKNDHFKGQRELESLRQLHETQLEQLEKINKALLSEENKQQNLTNKKVELQQRLAVSEQKLIELNQQDLLSQQKRQAEQKQQDLLITEQEQLEKEIVETEQLLDSLLKSSEQNNRLANKNNNDLLSQLTSDIQCLQQQSQYYHHEKVTVIDEKHQLELRFEKIKNDEVQCQQNIARFQESITQLTLQQQKHNQQIESKINPLINDEQQLQVWLAEMASIDQQLIAHQQSLVEIKVKIDRVEQLKQQTIDDIEQLKTQLNQVKLNGENYRLKAASALEQLNELGQNLQSVKESMPNNARESHWQAQLIKLAKDIQLLGAINLAAIDEFETQITRKNYLDQQDQDLNLAITTLESAIEKIDKESRDKFKITFDKVNQDLQALFPKVFGGGHAFLTLTGEDLLDAGVTIMARPPGKKNSTIHLLSGGEKALTALSLVFAIFRLNPAPFCMLDEVDAPLDDANVSRFCNLVNEMSQTVQFIYISHNKIAMEMASHLTGVTMFEAGVSRLVAVDIDEAIAMAEVS